MKRIVLKVDDDDERAIQGAIATYQKRTRWPEERGGGVLIPEGDSDLPGAILGEICRGWMEAYG
jgi:hypothetical protein